MCKTVDDITVFASDKDFDSEYDLFNAFASENNCVMPFDEAVKLIPVIRNLLVVDKRIVEQTARIIIEKRGI